MTAAAIANAITLILLTGAVGGLIWYLRSKRRL